ncbi:MAG TPA: DUF4380 domain-containing protein [Terriglobia bacterium]|nr:DUF4380 domain-containing protein [Terriglobia bacterium]
MSTIAEQSIAGFPCTVTREDYRGWRSVRLANGIMELFVVPEIGGRVIQLRIGDSDLLYVNRRHAGRVFSPEENNLDLGWKNYGGSKVWPAPQGWSGNAEWPGPPDPVLDGGPYSCQVLNEQQATAAVRLESQPDEYTGLTLSRTIRIFQDSSTIEIRHTMRNTSSRPVRWAVWQVTQQPAHRDLSVFVPSHAYRQTYGDRVYEGISFDPQEQLCRLRYVDQVAKFTMIPEQGWLSTLDTRRAVALAETFPLFPASPYPDDAAVEFWVNGHGSFTIQGERIDVEQDPNGCDPYIETEVLSPLVQLQPREEYAFQTSWHCTSIDVDTISSVNRFAGIGNRLMARRHGKEVRITGSFGFFQVGLLELVCVFHSGKVGGVQTLGSCGPLAACQLDCSLPLEEGLNRIRLRLRGRSGSVLGIVDDAVVS